jgi:copper(I)-binding protein
MAPPSATTHAAYLTIVNEGRQTQELVAAGAEGYDNIEIHNTTVTNGVASMRRVESVAVPAGGKIEFKPGGLHLMLIDAKKPLEHGALIPIRLGFRKGTKIETEAIVINNGPKGDAEASQHDHGGPGNHKAH